MDTSSGVKASVHIARPTVLDSGHELIRVKDPVTLVIFGASGDLSKRKLIPALFQLQKSGYLPDRYAIL